MVPGTAQDTAAAADLSGTCPPTPARRRPSVATYSSRPTHLIPCCVFRDRQGSSCVLFLRKLYLKLDLPDTAAVPSMPGMPEPEVMYHPIYPHAAPTGLGRNINSSSNSAAAVYVVGEQRKSRLETRADWWCRRGPVDSFCFFFSLRVGEIRTADALNDPPM